MLQYKHQRRNKKKKTKQKTNYLQGSYGNILHLLKTECSDCRDGKCLFNCVCVCVSECWVSAKQSFIELHYTEMWTLHEGILLLLLWYSYTSHLYVTLHKHLFFMYCFLLIVCVVGSVYKSCRVFGCCYHATIYYKSFFQAGFSFLYMKIIFCNNPYN